jgi:N-acetylmuramoyl-L-alanine amidase
MGLYPTCHMKLVSAGVIAFIAAHAAGPVAAQTAPPADRPRVVIDPGHGGSNTGTAAPELGILEKDVVLRLAERVRARLANRGIDVAMTRRDDRTLTLRQRMAFASQQRADVFVSIHANASSGRAQRGFETFVLTPAAIQVDGRALRAEPLASRAGVDPGTALILDDVERGAAQWSSADLAAAIQRELRVVRGTALDRGVRQDSQHVLLGATMPAVLVEVGFLNHPLEGRELLDPAVEERIAEAIARAIASQLGLTPDRRP